MQKMKKRFVLLALIVIVFSSLSFTPDNRSYTQDSLLSIKLQEKGKNAGRLGDYEEALSLFSQVYKVRLRMYGNDSYRLAPLLVNMGIQYKNLGNMDKAIDSYKKAEALYVKNFGNDYVELGVVYINLGNIYRKTGDYNKSLEYQKNAYRILQKADVKFNSYLQFSKYNIAETQLKQGSNITAIQFALLNIGTTLPILKPRLYDLIALGYQNEEKYDLSERYYLLAIKSWIGLYGENNIELAADYLAYSSFLISQKKFEAAFVYSVKADNIISNFYGAKNTSYAEVQSNFGDYYYMKNLETRRINDFRSQQKKYLKESIQYYQNAIVALVDSFQTKDPFVDPPLKNVISEIQLIEEFKKKALAMEKLADIYLSESDYGNSNKYLNASLNSLTNATELIHRLQIGFDSEESKYFLTQNQVSTFNEAIKISFKLYSQTRKNIYVYQAFEFSERSKSSNLLASVKEIKAKEFGGIPDSLLTKEKNLKNNSANYTSMLFEEIHSVKPDSQKVNLYSAKIFKYNEEYNRLIDSFEKLYPRYYSFKYENKVSGIREVQSKLGQRQALVEFFVDEPGEDENQGEIYRFVVTKDSVDFSMEKIDCSFLKNIQIVHDFLTNPNYLYTKKSDYVSYAVSGYELYSKLLQPVGSKIKGKDLIIIPHDKLSYIPFDALLSQKPDTSIMNFMNLKYLIREYVINYSYSATLLYNYLEQNKRSSKSILIFSPNYDSNTPYVDPETSSKRFLSPLSGAKEEVKNISKQIQSDLFLGDLAQEGVFKEKCSEYDVLHLAMHTIINDSLPMYSKLVFSNPDSKSKDDGYLNTYEIYNLNLKARLAVLSACETGSGKLQRGEGVMSMARGFIYSGCPSIVMTLWKVEDKSGASIMEDFYSYLSQGKRKDVALRMAKLKHLESADPLTSHPHYWLGYVNIGNSDPLYPSKDVYFVVFLLLVVLFLVLDWYIRSKRKLK